MLKDEVVEYVLVAFASTRNKLVPSLEILYVKNALPGTHARRPTHFFPKFFEGLGCKFAMSVPHYSTVDARTWNALDRIRRISKLCVNFLCYRMFRCCRHLKIHSMFRLSPISVLNHRLKKGHLQGLLFMSSVRCACHVNVITLTSIWITALRHRVQLSNLRNDWKEAMRMVFECRNMCSDKEVKLILMARQWRRLGQFLLRFEERKFAVLL